jgi:hypothetical protein
VGIGTTTPSYPLEVNKNVSGISIYASGNISATDYITRTSVYDKKKSVWDYIKDASSYLIGGKIDHSKFYGYSSYNITDYGRPLITEKQGIKEEAVFNEITNTTEFINATYYYNETSYPFEKTIEGVSLSKEIDVLRQGLYLLKLENDLLKAELCKKDNTYLWCK